ncbi:MAG: PLP-dependent transferase [bacterium TMED144]|nr:MAG: PLP-dependent transferase [bacterium TMED144]
MKSEKKSKLGFSTKSIHIGNTPDKEFGSISPPIHLTSTFLKDSVYKNRGHDYSRVSNPTRDRLEQNLAALDNAKYATCFSTGMAATTALFQLFNKGDHIIISRNTYGGTYRMSMNVLLRHGIEFDWVDTRKVENVEYAIKPNTKLIHVETPTNPMLEICDLENMSRLCKEKNILFSVDNTFMSPYGQRPIDHGADVVMQSSTKSLSGHSDLLGGVLTTNDKELDEKLHFILKATGAVPSPFDNWILLRSTKTLSLRYQRSCDNAMKIAEWLNKKNLTKKLLYPGLKSHPQFLLAAKQQLNPNGKRIFGNMISFDVGSEEKRDVFLERLEIFSLAESLGGVESLVCVPYDMTHAAVPEESKLEMGITKSLIRLSIGIEDYSDLIDDLNSSFS